MPAGRRTRAAHSARRLATALAAALAVAIALAKIAAARNFQANQRQQKRETTPRTRQTKSPLVFLARAPMQRSTQIV